MQKKKEAPLKRRKRRRTNGLGYLALFAVVFVSALFGLSHFVKSYSPEVDVTIGNTEALTLNEADMEVEMKTVDERLKWIKMEDDLPTVSIRKDNDESDKKDKKEDKKKKHKEKNKEKETDKKDREIPQVIEPPRPTSLDINKQSLDFRIKQPVIEAPKPIQLPSPSPTPAPIPAVKTVSKVFVGNFQTIEEAIDTQQRIVAQESDLIPFIKSINGQYVVQVGSFSDQDKAIALSTKMKLKGYSTRIVVEK